MPPEFSRPVKLASVNHGPGRSVTLLATPAECEALARRFGILAVDRLEARLDLRLDSGGAVLVTGQLAAEAVQECVVSLDPVAESVRAALAVRLLPPGREPADGPEDPDEVECPDGTADLGEVVAEQLALALEPYPRAAGAVLPTAARDASGDPFAALAGVRRKL
jgi:uncharacterized metal-binding protein YceD (DUF177 family)